MRLAPPKKFCSLERQQTFFCPFKRKQNPHLGRGRKKWQGQSLNFFLRCLEPMWRPFVPSFRPDGTHVKMMMKVPPPKTEEGGRCDERRDFEVDVPTHWTSHQGPPLLPRSPKMETVSGALVSFLFDGHGRKSRRDTKVIPLGGPCADGSAGRGETVGGCWLGDRGVLAGDGMQTVKGSSGWNEKS